MEAEWRLSGGGVEAEWRRSGGGVEAKWMAIKVRELHHSVHNTSGNTGVDMQVAVTEIVVIGLSGI